MFNRNQQSKDQSRAEILLAGQSLSFKLDSNETMKLIENLEEASYDFKKMESIRLHHQDGRIKTIINPLQISRIWFN